MPAYNFKQQFAPLVKSGQKRQLDSLAKDDGFANGEGMVD